MIDADSLIAGEVILDLDFTDLVAPTGDMTESERQYCQGALDGAMIGVQACLDAIIRSDVDDEE